MLKGLCSQEFSSFAFLCSRILKNKFEMKFVMFGNVKKVSAMTFHNYKGIAELIK